MKRLIPRYEDKFACPECGGLLEAFYPKIAVPLWAMKGVTLAPRDKVTFVSSGGKWDGDESEYAVLTHFCFACNMDFCGSHVRIFRDELPEYAFYTDDHPKSLGELMGVTE